MRHYEIVFIVHPDQSEQVPAMIERYKTVIAAKGGHIHRLEDWGRLQLAYTIQKMHKAHYILMNIEIDQETLDELDTVSASTMPSCAIYAGARRSHHDAVAADEGRKAWKSARPPAERTRSGSSLNQFEFAASLMATSGPRTTPAGMPVLRFQVQHTSEQQEAGKSRPVIVETEMVAYGKVAR